MEANQDPAPAPFAEVEPFTGEPESYPVGTVNPPVPLMRSQTQFHTAVAVQRPRNLDKVVAAVLREAEFAGDAFYYSFPMGGKKIEGPSIGLAMAVAREWSNCAVPVEYYETATEWVFNAHFVDLERGFTVSRVFRKKKGKGVFKKLEDDRAEDMTFQAAQSRAIRNVVLAGVPRWLTDQAKETGQGRGAQGDQQGRPGRGHGQGPEIPGGLRHQRRAGASRCWANPSTSGPRRTSPACGAWPPNSKTARPRPRSYFPRWPRLPSSPQREESEEKGRSAKGEKASPPLRPPVSCPWPPRRSRLRKSSRSAWTRGLTWN